MDFSLRGNDGEKRRGNDGERTTHAAFVACLSTIRATAWGPFLEATDGKYAAALKCGSLHSQLHKPTHNADVRQIPVFQGFSQAFQKKPVSAAFPPLRKKARPSPVPHQHYPRQYTQQPRRGRHSPGTSKSVSCRAFRGLCPAQQAFASGFRPGFHFFMREDLSAQTGLPSLFNLGGKPLIIGFAFF